MIGEPCDMVVMLNWEDMAAPEAALGSEIGQHAAEDAAVNLARYATFRGMILQLDEVGWRTAAARGVPGSSIVTEAGLVSSAALPSERCPDVVQY